jgi:hypothetical protein
MKSWMLGTALLVGVGMYAYAFSSEAPVGALRGKVMAADTNQPLAKVRVVARPATPRNGSDTLTTTTDEEGNFLLPRLPAGAYELARPSTKTNPSPPR